MSKTPRRHSDRLQADAAIGELIGMEEFCDRFVASMIVRVFYNTFPNGCLVLDYAMETAPTYWDHESLRELGPENCVVSDMRHWHETWD